MGIAHQFVDEVVSAEGIKSLVDLRPWMRYKRMELIDTLAALDKFVEEACEKGRCVIDLETDSLNTGPDGRGRGSKVASIAGVCLSYHKDYGVYIPVSHQSGRNLPLGAVIQRMKRLVAECLTIYHNFKYDGEIMRNHGVIIEDPKKYRDTLLGAAVLFSDRKSKGLKGLSKDMLGKEMIELSEIVPNRANIDFRALHPKDAVFYGASDGVCTMELYEYEQALLEEWDPSHNNGTFFIYEVEHACQIVVMEMERNLCKIDVGYYQALAKEVEKRVVELEDEIFAAAGEVFDINSGKQLGALLFEKFKLPYPMSEKSKTGDYFVKDEVLEKIADKHALPRLVQEYREINKVYSTYLVNLLTNVDANSCVKFQMNQTMADSGRFSASGGKGLLEDGYSGVNCQNIPAVKDGDHWKLRKGIMARPGFKIVTIDYSGEELRIATNFSKEKVWIKEFNEGTGDLHSITAAMLFGGHPSEMNSPEHKWKRKIAKSVNFLILYGGGASKLAQNAKIPLAEAQERLDKFFEQMEGLTEWMKIERIRAKKRGYSLTAFGRRRPLSEMYKSGDRGLISKADRLAINAAIQGCLASFTRVLTSKGYLKIGDVFERGLRGEQFEVWTGHRWAPFHALNRGSCERAEIILKNGHQLDCDTRHQILTVGDKGYEFKHYSDIAEGDLVCMSPCSEKEFGQYPLSYKSRPSSNMTPILVEQDDVHMWGEVAWLLGLIIGDGCVSADKGTVQLYFGAQKVGKLVPRVNKLLSKMGLTDVKVSLTTGSQGEAYSANVYSTALVEMLTSHLGYVPATAKGKRIPESIWSAPLPMRAQFLCGYCDTDGAKQRRSRYNFHTPNKELLREIQVLGRTLGLASRICSDNEGNPILDWTDLDALEKVVGMPVEEREKHHRIMSNESVVPSFMVPACLEVLDGVYDRKDRNDCALMCKLRKGNRVLVSTIFMLCKKYGVTPPQLYEVSPVVSKRALGYEEDTYTLSVQDEGHRFDGEGVIHKNTGADIIKIALYRVWCYIRKNNLQNDVKILMPIHDEIVYEMREDKLDMLIPAIAEVMKIRDLSTALKWSVHLEVDAEYDDTMMVKKNYFEDLKEGITAAVRLGMEKDGGPAKAQPIEKTHEEGTQEQEGSEVVIEFDNNSSNFSKEVDLAGEERKLSSTSDNSSLAGETPVNTTTQGSPSEIPNMGSTEFFAFEVSKSDRTAKAQADMIWTVLDGIDNLCQAGGKKRIRLTKDKKVLYTTPKSYSVEGFLALAYMYSI